MVWATVTVSKIKYNRQGVTILSSAIISNKVKKKGKIFASAFDISLWLVQQGFVGPVNNPAQVREWLVRKMAPKKMIGRQVIATEGERIEYPIHYFSKKWFKQLRKKYVKKFERR